ncbi:hypothetical protein B0T24DRAFT_617038 [Lasiosphaeria ovina]|uniref:Ankyrin repeat domain-containing protein n=1 Tax=Lasiosphaeria ovina TaxID=92902 RepID=A0AAE0KFK8_9PEZI|nr:hypothetical protein B0T24DRAFT_617038 [Lasiosphaeria ovina]
MLAAHRHDGAAVDLEREDSSGRTALSWAVEYGHPEVVRALLRAGADPDAENSKGIAPKTAALRGLKRTEIVELLQNAGKG